MKKLFNAAFMALALTVALLVSGGAVCAATTNASGGSVITIAPQDVNTSKSLTKYTTTVTAGSYDVIPVKAKETGLLRIDITGRQAGYGIMLSLHSDSSAAAGSLIDGIIPGGSNPDTAEWECFSVKKNKTYYLRVTSLSNYQTEEPQSVTYTVSLYPAAATMANKKETKTGAATTGWQYYKIKAPLTGYMNLNLKEQDNAGNYYTVKLFKKNKKAEAVESVVPAGKEACFYVKKNTTYYVGVKSSRVTYVRYKLKPTFKAWKDQAGSSKKKAKTIKKGGTVKGLILPTDKLSKGDWYKVNMNKNGKLMLSFKTYMSGGFKIQVSSTKLYNEINGSAAVTGADKYEALCQTTSYGSLLKGTYYIRVTPLKGKTSGAYSLKVTY